MAERRPDGGGGLARSEPRLDLQLPLPGGFVLYQLEVQVQVLEVPYQLATWTLHFDDLGVNFDVNAVRYVHGFR